MKSLQAQLTMMSQIVSQLKKDKESSAKQVKDMEAALQGYIQKIRVKAECLRHLPVQTFHVVYA